jgi:CRP/FNR family cyclic AMP-dependent transcriptional regulator
VNATDALGYLASLLVLATFCMRRMVALRLLAIASNLAFIVYAMLAGIHPVLLLHALLLPMNVWRLVEIVRGRDAAANAGALP